MVTIFHKPKGGGGAAAIRLKDSLSEEEKSLTTGKNKSDASGKYRNKSKGGFFRSGTSNKRFSRLEDQGGGVSFAEEEYVPPQDFFAESNQKQSSQAAKEATPKEEHDEFSQFVFDQTVNTLQTETIADSDSGTSDNDAKNIAKIMRGVSNLHKADVTTDESAANENFDLNGAASNPFHSVKAKKQQVKKKPKTIKPKVISPAVLGNKTQMFNNRDAHGSSSSNNQTAAKSFSSATEQSKKQVRKPKLPPLALGSNNNSRKPRVPNVTGGGARPPSTITTSDDATITSNISTTNATVMSTADELSPNHPFAHDNCRDPFDLEPTTVDDTVWSPTNNPFQQSSSNEESDAKGDQNNVNDTVEPSLSMDESLIDSIRKASSKDKCDKDSVGHKPDPSPRGMSSEQEAMPPPPPPPPPLLAPPRSHHHGARAPASHYSSARSSRSEAKVLQKVLQGDQPTKSKTHKGFGHDNGFDSAFDVEKKNTTATKTVPENAILASMLFRSTEKDEEIKKVSSVSEEKEEDDVSDDDEENQPLEIPPSIQTDESAESVSSVTEEANSFYQKNFQGWKKQAHSVLEQYHQARKSRKKDPNSYRAEASTSLLEKVEEENMLMFKG